MFSSQVQNGTKGVEILTPSGTGRENSKLVKFMGNLVTREYERDIKGYMYLMDKPSNSTSIACPASNKHSLGISQPLLVFQLQSFLEANFHLEIAVIDHTDRKHRLHIATAYRRFETNGLHAQIPWYVGDVEEGQWTQVVFDLNFLTEKCFEAGFMNLDSFLIKPSVKVRNIFSLPMSARRAASVSSLAVPKALHFPPGVSYDTKFFDESIEYALIAPPLKDQTGVAAVKKSKKVSPTDPTQQASELGVTGVTVRQTKRAMAVTRAKEKEKTARKSQEVASTPHKPAISVTASRRAQTAAKIAKRKAEERAAEDMEGARHRREVSSVGSPGRTAVKAKVAQAKKGAARKVAPVTQPRAQVRSPTKGRREAGSSRSVYESLEHQALSPPKVNSPQKRATRPVSITTRSGPLPAAKPAGWGSKADLTDSGSGSEGDAVEEELLAMEPQTEREPNPWAEVNLTRVTTPPTVETRLSFVRSSENDDVSVAPGLTVFRGLGLDGTGEEERHLTELQNKLEMATLSLTEAEREYIMEFGELPE